MHIQTAYLFTTWGLLLFFFPLSQLWNEIWLGIFAVILILLLRFWPSDWERLNVWEWLVVLLASLVLLMAEWLATSVFLSLSLIGLLLLLLLSLSFLLMVRRFGARVFFWLMILIFLLQAQWGVAQFVGQSDMGLYLLGETRLSADATGVAKFSFLAIWSDKVVRAYGPYAHANVFGGVMVMAYVLLGIHVVLRPQIFYPLLFVFALAVLVSFSRSAYLMMVIATVVSLLLRYRGLRDVGEVRRLVSFFLLLLLVVSPFLYARWQDGEDQALRERLLYTDWSWSLLSEQPFWMGVGLGQYEVSLQNYLDREGITYEPWHIDLVHSVPLVLAVELGVIWGALLLLLLIVFAAGAVRSIMFLVLLSPLVLLDHYLISQPAALLVMILLLLLLRYTARDDKGGVFIRHT